MPHWPGAGFAQAAGFRTNWLVGSMQWQFRFWLKRGCPGTRFSRVFWPYQPAWLLEEMGTRDGNSGLEEKQPAEDPSGGRIPQEPVGDLPGLLNFIAEARVKDERDVVGGDALLVRAVEDVVDARNRRRVCGQRACRIGFRLGPGECRGNREPVRVALGHFDLQRVVPTVAERRAIDGYRAIDLRVRAQRLKHGRGCGECRIRKRYSRGFSERAAQGGGERRLARGGGGVDSIPGEGCRVRCVQAAEKSAVVLPCAAVADVVGFHDEIPRITCRCRPMLHARIRAGRPALRSV